MLGIGVGEAIFLLLVGLIVLGPEKLPRIVADVVRTARALARMAADARDEVRLSLEPELQALKLDELRLDTSDDGPSAGRSAAARPQVRHEPGRPPPYDLEAT